jgi:hypothetical protein
MYGLVLVVNRRPINAPSIQIADPTSIPVTFRDIQPLHRPRVAERVGLLANAASPAAGPLCGRRAPLFVRADTGAGFAYPAREALVQALNAACGRPVDPAFVAAVQQEPPPPPPCPPCRPQAGRVCPDAVSAPAIACVQP